MKTSWMPIVAGVMNLIVGVSTSLFGIYLSILMATNNNVETIVIIKIIFTFVFGILAIIGGVYSFKKERFHLASDCTIISSIGLVLGNAAMIILPIPIAPYGLATWVLFYFGLVIAFWGIILASAILAIFTPILLALSRKEFNHPVSEIYE